VDFGRTLAAALREQQWKGGTDALRVIGECDAPFHRRVRTFVQFVVEREWRGAQFGVPSATAGNAIWRRAFETEGEVQVVHYIARKPNDRTFLQLSRKDRIHWSDSGRAISGILGLMLVAAIIWNRCTTDIFLGQVMLYRLNVGVRSPQLRNYSIGTCWSSPTSSTIWRLTQRRTHIRMSKPIGWTVVYWINGWTTNALQQRIVVKGRRLCGHKWFSKGLRKKWTIASLHPCFLLTLQYAIEGAV
jgi:hypothetical protein